MRILLTAALLCLPLAAPPVLAETITLAPVEVPEWKAVYGQVEARDQVAARARIGGTLVELLVTEGDLVEAGQRIARVHDDKLAFQVDALDAQLRALEAQLTRAEAELTRGRELVERGVITPQRLEQLETDVEVVQNQIGATGAERLVVLQQAEEGDVLAPLSGLVLEVPVTRDAVIMGGEPVAMIGGGGLYLRLAIPERHAADLREGASLRIASAEGAHEGRLVKLYPRIEQGRVIADVEVESLDSRFIDARVLVRVPVGSRETLLIPRAALTMRSGLDFVRVRQADHEIDRTVVVGEPVEHDGITQVEVLTGLHEGEIVILP